MRRTSHSFSFSYSNGCGYSWGRWAEPITIDERRLEHA